MKATPVLTLLSALIAGIGAWYQNSEALRLRDQAGSLAAELTSKEAVGQRQATLLATLQTENDTYRAEVDALRTGLEIDASSDVAENAQVSPPPARSKNNTAEVFAQISADPKMKEVIRQWNFAKVREIYGGFVKDHHLGPLQTKQLFDLLTEERMQTKEEYFDLFATGESENGPSQARIQSWLKQKAEVDRQLGMLLGNDIYAEFERQYRMP
jgi:uncharacterized protein YbaA (DUF1428 family)